MYCVILINWKHSLIDFCFDLSKTKTFCEFFLFSILFFEISPSRHHSSRQAISSEGQSVLETTKKDETFFCTTQYLCCLLEWLQIFCQKHVLNQLRLLWSAFKCQVFFVTHITGTKHVSMSNRGPDWTLSKC